MTNPPYSILPNKEQGVLKTVLFHRQYMGYTGGHGKVWDYFNHIKKSGLYEPMIFFTGDSVFDEGNPWVHSKEYFTKEWEPEKADLLFLAGMDWQAMPREWNKKIPVFNLIQGVRHADPDLPLYGFLKKPAVRICVSQPVADAILATGQVNGPVHVIPNGIHIPDELSGELPKNNRILIAALKDVSAGTQIAGELQNLGYEVELLTHPISKIKYLKRIKEARVAILLPLPVEGFYLPGLEAMALGTPVIMPDCIGNREYANHEENCLITTRDHMISAVRYFDSPGENSRIRQAGFETAKRYTLDREYERFLGILGSIEAGSGKNDNAHRN